MNGKRTRQPTLADVARRANVSKQTISRVINNKGEVSPSTRQRVLDAIRELDYQPNALAQSLATSRSLVIGLTIPDIDQPFFPQIARGVEDAAAESGYSVFLGNASSDPARELRAIERLRGHRVAGIISFNSRLTDAQISHAVGGVFPVVMINREGHPARGTVIWPGYEAGAQLATAHLVGLGRRRIAFLGLDPDSNVDADKLRGYEAALRAANIPVEPDLVFRAPNCRGRGFDDLVRTGHEMMAAIIDRSLDVDAVFASNDLPAIGAMRLAVTRGMRVPEKIAIIGFGGANVASIVTPTLSTITMPLHKMGEAAFHTMLNRINGVEGETEPIETAPELIIRESTAGPIRNGDGVALQTVPRPTGTTVPPRIST